MKHDGVDSPEVDHNSVTQGGETLLSISVLWLSSVPAASIRANFDDRRALLHGISRLWHHAASEVLGDHRGPVTRAGLVLWYRRAFHQARIAFLRGCAPRWKTIHRQS